MDPSHRSIRLEEAFPDLAPAACQDDRERALVAALRAPDWQAISLTLALAACRRRDRAVGELVGFPAAWQDRDLAGDWGAPARPPDDHVLRAMRRAGLVQWRDLADRTPSELLSRSGAGLRVLTDVVACAIELSAVYLTNPNVRHSAGPFGAPAPRAPPS